MLLELLQTNYLFFLVSSPCVFSVPVPSKVSTTPSVLPLSSSHPALICTLLVPEIKAAKSVSFASFKCSEMHKDSPCKCNQLLPVLMWHNSRAVTGHKQRHGLLMIYNTLPWGPSPKASQSHLSRMSPHPPEAAFLLVAPQEARLPMGDIPLSAELDKMDVWQLYQIFNSGFF